MKDNFSVRYVDKTIVEVCFPLFKFVYDLNNGILVSDFQLLQAKIIHEFFTVEEELKRLGMSEAVFMDVKFVMSAFLDEMISRRGDDCAHAWSKDSLQIQFFKENLGGEKFFERLSYLQRFSDKRFDILELYYWCLALGYQGKYCKDDVRDLSVIQENLSVSIKPYQVSSYAALDFKDVPILKEAKNTGLGVCLRKISLGVVFLIVFSGGVVIYGAHTLAVKYLLRGLKVFSTHLV